MVNVQANTSKVASYHMDKSVEENNEDNSSIGSIEAPSDVSTKLLLDKELKNFFEVEEILRICQERRLGEESTENEKNY